MVVIKAFISQLKKLLMLVSLSYFLHTVRISWPQGGQDMRFALDSAAIILLNI